MNHGADEEVAAEFEGVGLTRLRADHRDAPRHGLKHRTRTLDGVGRSRSHNPKPALRGDIGPAKHGSRHELLAAARVLRGEPLRERDADSAARDMKGAGIEGIDESI